MQTAFLPFRISFILFTVVYSDWSADCLSTQLLELRLTVEGLERERDFYFSKLTDIEVDHNAELIVLVITNY